MMTEAAMRKVASRAAANLVAVVAITAIFGLKAFIDHQASHVLAVRDGDRAVLAATADYDPYLTEQP
jgi:hypothetical protein